MGADTCRTDGFMERLPRIGIRPMTPWRHSGHPCPFLTRRLASPLKGAFRVRHIASSAARLDSGAGTEHRGQSLRIRRCAAENRRHDLSM